MTSQTLQKIKQSAEPILKRNGVAFAGVFGSYARAEEKPTSDVDLVVRFDSPKGIFELVGLSQELSEMLGRRVDVVSEKAVHPYLRKRIAKDLEVIYGQRQYL